MDTRDRGDLNQRQQGVLRSAEKTSTRHLQRRPRGRAKDGPFRPFPPGDRKELVHGSRERKFRLPRPAVEYFPAKPHPHSEEESAVGAQGDPTQSWRQGDSMPGERNSQQPIKG